MSGKILILSWCNADNVMNYGQILQAIAMMQLVRSDYDGEIDYISYHPRTMKNKIRCILERYSPLSGHLMPYCKTKEMINKVCKENNVKLYQISNAHKLEEMSSAYNLMICGSDQIWHPRNYFPEYFLDFGNDAIVRKSYAASLPKSAIEPQFASEYEKMRKSLERLDYISVRECSSKKLIETLSGKNVDIVLDPTFLIPKEQWETLMEYIKIPKRYIFVYIPNGMDDSIEQKINQLSSAIGVQNIVILMTRGNNGFKRYKTIKFVTVGQFLYLIKHADYIFTSSFHAAVFSIIMKKQFSCHTVYNSEQGEDTRFTDLLEPLGLDTRIDNDTSFIEHINYNKLSKILEEKLNFSRKTLNKIISA